MGDGKTVEMIHLDCLVSSRPSVPVVPIGISFLVWEWTRLYHVSKLLSSPRVEIYIKFPDDLSDQATCNQRIW